MDEFNGKAGLAILGFQKFQPYIKHAARACTLCAIAGFQRICIEQSADRTENGTLPNNALTLVHLTNYMPLILFNKPYQVMCQFSAHPTRPTLASFLSIPQIYPAGRLDADSEGLVLLTDDGNLQHATSHPERKLPKTYIVQVEGSADRQRLERLRKPLNLGDFITRECEAKLIQEPDWLWQRNPPIRQRSNLPTSWLAITLQEGKNRQVRRMTAAVGLPTLRLVRIAIGPFTLEHFPLLPGEWTEVDRSVLTLD